MADAEHRHTLDRPELYTFVEVSQNNYGQGQGHYDDVLAHRERVRAVAVRPLTNTKIYGADTGKSGTTRDGIERFWRNVFAGASSARFHRPPSGLGLSPIAQRMIQSAREVTNAFDIFACEPHNDLLGSREENEAYCLADPGKQYAVYFPGAGEVTLNVKEAGRSLELRWYDVDHGQWQPAQIIESSAAVPLKTPGDGQWAVVAKAQG